MGSNRAEMCSRSLRWACALVALPLLYSVIHWITWRSLVGDGWLESWEHLTQLDRSVGVRLRRGFVGQLGKVAVVVNADGLRSAAPGGHVAAKQGDELLVVAAGDSNTFGVLAPLDKTYSSLLEHQLASQLSRRVRVVNLGVPGYSTMQTAQAIKHFEYLRPDILVVVADSFNDRACVGRPDSPGAFTFESRFARPYEFGDYVSYPVLYFHRRLSLLPKIRTTPPPTFDVLPVPRVPISEHRRQLFNLVKYANERNVRLIFLMTGDAIDSRQSKLALDELASERWTTAHETFRQMHNVHPGWFLPAFYAYRSAERAHEPLEMEKTRAAYVQHFAVDTERYLSTSAHFAVEYADSVLDLMRLTRVALVDVREEFRRASVQFADAAHYDQRGHEVVAAQVTEAIVKTATREVALQQR